MELRLPETPRIGDKIDLRMFDDQKYSRGCVYEVNHMVFGNEVEMQVHPRDNEYHRWLKLKKEYEWIESIRPQDKWV